MMNRFFSAIAAALALSAIVLPGVSLAQAGKGLSWKNPETGIAVQLPPGWTPLKNQPSSAFGKGDYEAVLMCEPATIQYADMQDYARVVHSMMSAENEMEPVKSGVPALKGVHRQLGYQISSALTNAGGRFCRVDFYAPPKTGAADRTDPALSKALFASLGDKPMVKAAAEKWRNPETGKSVIIPNGWIYQTDEAEPLFRKGDNFAAPACQAVPPQIRTLSDYGLAIQGQANADLTPFRPAGSDTILASNGYDPNSKTPFTVVISFVGKKFCQITYGRLGGGKSGSLNDPALSAALFESMK